MTVDDEMVGIGCRHLDRVPITNIRAKRHRSRNLLARRNKNHSVAGFRPGENEPPQPKPRLGTYTFSLSFGGSWLAILFNQR